MCILKKEWHSSYPSLYIAKFIIHKKNRKCTFFYITFLSFSRFFVNDKTQRDCYQKKEEKFRCVLLLFVCILCVKL